MDNHFIDLDKIYIPKYIYLDEIYDYDDILMNIQRKSQKETKKRKRTDDNGLDEFDEVD
uniref:Uncharacterized protein n=1 Tax=viral metagenome TaxID=1070528 RepID=A0A6C0EPM7_9ZZZZ